MSLALAASLAMTGCKSKQSNYRKAYEKAQAQEMQQQTEETEQVAVTPVVTTQPTQTTTNENFRSESLNVIGGGTLKAYSVVCGSFKSQDNANNLRNTLKNAGYNALVAQNTQTGMYRVVASSFDDKNAAISSRNTLRATYPDAWLLMKAN